MLDALNYDEWANKMKFHLIGVHPSLLEVVNVGAYQPKEDDEVTQEMIQDLHRNAQAVSIILGSLSSEEYRKVEGRESAKDIWDTIKLSHEGDNKSKRHPQRSLCAAGGRPDLRHRAYL